MCTPVAKRWQAFPRGDDIVRSYPFSIRPASVFADVERPGLEILGRCPFLCKARNRLGSRRVYRCESFVQCTDHIGLGGCSGPAWIEAFGHPAVAPSKLLLSGWRTDSDKRFANRTLDLVTRTEEEAHEGKPCQPSPMNLSSRFDHLLVRCSFSKARGQIDYLPARIFESLGGIY